MKVKTLTCLPCQVKTPVVNAKSKVLVPGLPGHQAPVKGTPQESEKRKKGADTKEVGLTTLGYRIHHLFLLTCV